MLRKAPIILQGSLASALRGGAQEPDQDGARRASHAAASTSSGRAQQRAAVQGGGEKQEGTPSIGLSWQQRLQIALDVAQGLAYLHQVCCSSSPHVGQRPYKTGARPAALHEAGVLPCSDAGYLLTWYADSSIVYDGHFQFWGGRTMHNIQKCMWPAYCSTAVLQGHALPSASLPAMASQDWQRDACRSGWSTATSRPATCCWRAEGTLPTRTLRTSASRSNCPARRRSCGGRPRGCSRTPCSWAPMATARPSMPLPVRAKAFPPISLFSTFSSSLSNWLAMPQCCNS